MGVQEHQPHWREDSATGFALPPSRGAIRTGAETVAGGPGRLAHRRLAPSDVLGGYSDWPGLAHVVQRQRQGISKKTGAVRAEGGRGVTRLASEQAAAARILALGRGHWHSETKSHGGRDVTFDAERSQGRGGNIPQVMAARRQTVMGLRRQAGETNMAAACRRFAAQPAFALELIGMPLEN